jgi:hypothetical protein
MYNKYHAQKTWMKGRVYDSKKEANRAFELEMLEKYGKIHNLQKQVPFVLQEGYVNKQGKKIRPITYIADFTYEEDGKIIVEDTKGVETEVFKIKRKMLEYKYPDIEFRVL